VLLVNPVSYSKPAGYPIIAVTNLDFSSAGNGANAADLQHLAYMLVTKTPEAVGPGKITSIDLYGRSNIGQTGYSTLNQGLVREQDQIDGNELHRLVTPPPRVLATLTSHPARVGRPGLAHPRKQA
jgi:hypothetical protein